MEVAACRSSGREVVVYLSIDQPFTEPILRDYERQSGVKVRAVFDTEETKSTGVLNRIVAEAKNLVCILAQSPLPCDHVAVSSRANAKL